MVRGGSGSHHHRSRREGTSGSRRTAGRPNQEGGSRRSTIRPSQDHPNHGSGSHRSTAPTGASQTVPEGTSERSNHGSGRHYQRRRSNTHRHRRHRPHRSERWIDYEDEDREYNLCGCFCSLLRALLGALLTPFYTLVTVFLRCGLNTQSRNNSLDHATTTSNVTESRRSNRHRRNPRSHPFTIPGGLISSLLLFVVLVWNSSSDNLITVNSTNRVSSVWPPPLSSSGLGAGPTNHADGATNENSKRAIYSSDLWTGYAGETQRVYLPRLVRSLRVTAVEGDPWVRAAVFRFAHRCPPLTGRPRPVEYSAELDLRSGEFVYDYNYLPRRSTIDVSFEQVTGLTGLYLLKGVQALEDMRTGTNMDASHWEKIAVAKRYITANEKDDFAYTVEDSDIYTLIYDNGSRHRTSSLDFHVNLLFSTYNLYGHNPVCDNLSGSPGMQSSCTLDVRRSNCVILETFLSSNDDEIDGDFPILLRIETYRNWILIGILSAIPWLISILIHTCCCFCFGCFSCGYCCGWFSCYPKSSVNDNDDDDDDDDDFDHDDDDDFDHDDDLEEPLLSSQQSCDDFDTPGEGERLLHGSPDQQPVSIAAPMPTAMPVPPEDVPPVVEATPIDDLVTDVH